MSDLDKLIAAKGFKKLPNLVTLYIIYMKPYFSFGKIHITVGLNIGMDNVEHNNSPSYLKNRLNH